MDKLFFKLLADIKLFGIYFALCTDALKDRVYPCECGLTIDRDLNLAPMKIGRCLLD